MSKSSQPFITTSTLAFLPSPEFTDDGEESLGWWQELWSIRSLLIVIAILGCVHIVSLSLIEMSRVRQSQARMVVLRQDIAVIEAELVDVQAVIAHGQDEAFIEQLARQQGFVYPDEMLIRTFDSQGNPVVVHSN